MKFFAISLWGAFGLLAISGCGGEPTAKKGTASSKETGKGGASKGLICVSVMNLTNPFFKTIGDTIAAEAAKKGMEAIVVSAEMDAAKQNNQVKDFIVKKATAIVLCPRDAMAIGPAIKEAHEAGIPVFTADTGCTDAKSKELVVCHIATDNLEGGRQAAKAMIEAVAGKPSKIAILDYPEAESCIMRVRGFEEVLGAHNAANPAKAIQIVRKLPGNGLPEPSARATEDILQAVPDLAAVFCINDPSALGCRAALEKAAKTGILIIGFDGQKEGKEAIKAGKIYADPIQFPEQIAAKTVEQIVRYGAGDKIEKEILIPTGLYRKADGEKDPELK